MKEIISILKELIVKVTPKQSFITILVIVGLTTGYFIYKDYNDTMVELATISKSKPSSKDNIAYELYGGMKENLGEQSTPEEPVRSEK